MRKLSSVFALLVVAAMLLSACAGAAPAATSDGAAAPAADAGAAAPAEATVDANAPTPEPTPVVNAFGNCDDPMRLWHGLTGSDGVTLNDMLTQFAAENPDISVTVEIIAWGTLYQKLQTAFVAGTQPDMILLHASEIPQFGSYGVLRDLSDQYTSGGGWLPDDDISETTMSGMSWDGVTYGIPLDNHGRGLWINTAMFDAAGISTDPATAEMQLRQRR